MKLLEIYPRLLRDKLIGMTARTGVKNPEKTQSNILVGTLLAALVASSLIFLLDIMGRQLFEGNLFVIVILTFFVTYIALNVFFYFKIFLQADARIKKMEAIFPDVVQLMSSNLRAGMTIDRAFLLSAREEFKPLDEEISKAGREITTGKDVGSAMVSMSQRIGSEKIKKTIMLIISGIKAGGNISTLLEETASNMREKEFIEKRAASNIIMYVIFIFFAAAIGAPILFALSSILVQVIIEIIGSFPDMGATSTSIKTPFQFNAIDLSITFVIWFSVIFIVVTDFLASLVIGLVNKGDEKEGLRYLLPMIAVSLSLFFIIRTVLFKFVAESFSLGT